LTNLSPLFRNKKSNFHQAVKIAQTNGFLRLRFHCGYPLSSSVAVSGIQLITVYHNPAPFVKRNSAQFCPKRKQKTALPPFLC